MQNPNLDAGVAAGVTLVPESNSVPTKAAPVEPLNSAVPAPQSSGVLTGLLKPGCSCAIPTAAQLTAIYDNLPASTVGIAGNQIRLLSQGGTHLLPRTIAYETEEGWQRGNVEYGRFEVNVAAPVGERDIGVIPSPMWTTTVASMSVNDVGQLNSVIRPNLPGTVHGAVLGAVTTAGAAMQAGYWSTSVGSALLLMMASESRLDVAGDHILAGTSQRCVNPTTPIRDIVMGRFPFANVHPATVLARCITADTYWLTLRGEARAPAGWTPDLWDTEIAIVFINQAWSQSLSANAAWTLAHLDYPYANIRQTTEDRIVGPTTCRVTSNRVHIPGPVAKVLYVCSGSTRAGDVRVGTPAGNAFVTTAANGFDPAGVDVNITPALDAFTVIGSPTMGADLAEALLRWMSIFATRRDFASAMMVMANFYACYRPRPQRRAAGAILAYWDAAAGAPFQGGYAGGPNFWSGLPDPSSWVYTLTDAFGARMCYVRDDMTGSSALSILNSPHTVRMCVATGLLQRSEPANLSWPGPITTEAMGVWAVLAAPTLAAFVDRVTQSQAIDLYTGLRPSWRPSSVSFTRKAFQARNNLLLSELNAIGASGVKFQDALLSNNWDLGVFDAILGGMGVGALPYVRISSKWLQRLQLPVGPTHTRLQLQCARTNVAIAGLGTVSGFRSRLPLSDVWSDPASRTGFEPVTTEGDWMSPLNPTELESFSYVDETNTVFDVYSVACESPQQGVNLAWAANNFAHVNEWWSLRPEMIQSLPLLYCDSDGNPRRLYLFMTDRMRNPSLGVNSTCQAVTVESVTKGEDDYATVEQSAVAVSFR